MYTYQLLIVCRNLSTSTISGLQTAAMSFVAKGKYGDHEFCCVNRKLLLEALAKELPSGTIRFSSKVVSIEISGFYKLVHLVDGTTLKTKVHSPKYKKREDDPIKMKQFVLSKLGNEYVPNEINAIVENIELDSIISSPLRYRYPWELLWGNINKDNVCVAGDALHPMTPNIGQGGCATLEDGVIFGQGNGQVTSFLRDNILATFLARLPLKRADFDCGKLNIS
ncbi:hypothetical protein CMV_010682 [Castanea mollissima]|uniref:FAD-binding domain-containing protein n=1 Tax=Castanea mollissima TaxID=60419 RepID=A0A8J4R6K9_9ROSI|nr:hypothetical protein CMV_010682 [Castanea mollissima]